MRTPRLGTGVATFATPKDRAVRKQESSPWSNDAEREPSVV